MTQMNKAQFELIANIISDSRAYLDDRSHEAISREMTRRLKETNKLFKEKLFLKACGVE